MSARPATIHDLTDLLVAKTGRSKAAVQDVLKHLFPVINQLTDDYPYLMIYGVGTFRMAYRAERLSRNTLSGSPGTPQAACRAPKLLPPSEYLKFTAAKSAVKKVDY